MRTSTDGSRHGARLAAVLGIAFLLGGALGCSWIKRMAYEDFGRRDPWQQPDRVVEALAPAIERLKGPENWSSLMLVAGATGPEEARHLRRLAPDALFLVPGYGAQGGGAADALAGFARIGDRLEGGVVNASRSVTFPEGSDTATDLVAWRALIEAAIDSAQSDLSAHAGQGG